MSIRRVVTGHDQAGRSVFLADESVQAKTARALPGLELYELWSTQGLPLLPHSGPFPGVGNFFPELGCSVFRVAVFEPAVDYPDSADDDEALAERDAMFPGLGDHVEPGSSMHTTDSVDYGIVCTGTIVLTLDDGQERTLTPGTVVIQNGTRHSWRNDDTEPAIMAFVLLGAHRNGATRETGE